MIITCPTCGHHGKIDPSRVPPQGGKAKCPKCQNSFPIRRPETQQPAAPPVPPATPAAGPPPTDTPEPPLQQPQTPETTAPEPAPSPPAPEPSLGFAGGSPAAAPDTGAGLSLKGPSAEAVASRDVACTGCLKLFNEDEITQVGDRVLCRACQDAFQAKGETPSPPSARPSYGMPAKKPHMEYGGFWIRVGAYLVDGVILGLIFYFILSPIFMKMATNMFGDMALYQDPQNLQNLDPAQMQALMADMAGKMMKLVWITNLLNMILMGGYFVVLEGGPGQTLGKKALGLRVVTPEGDRIGYLKALARYIGKIISGVILGIGFIMAAFDSEKRTLHDRMVNSRVVKE